MILALIVLRDHAVRWAPEDAVHTMAAVVAYSRRDWLRNARVAQNGYDGGDGQEGDGGSSAQQQRRRRGKRGEEAGSAFTSSPRTTRTASTDKMTDPFRNVKGHKPVFASPEKKQRIQECGEQPIAVGEASSSSSSPPEQEEPEESMPLDEVELACVADFDSTPPPPPSPQNGSDPASDVQIRDASAENDEDGDDETLHPQRVLHGPPPSSLSSSSSLPYPQASSSSSSQGNPDAEANSLHAPLATQPPSTEYNPRVTGMSGPGTTGLHTHDWPPIEEALWKPMETTFPALLAEFLSMIRDAELLEWIEMEASQHDDAADSQEGSVLPDAASINGLSDIEEEDEEEEGSEDDDDDATNNAAQQPPSSSTEQGNNNGRCKSFRQNIIHSLSRAIYHSNGTVRLIRTSDLLKLQHYTRSAWEVYARARHRQTRAAAHAAHFSREYRRSTHLGPRPLRTGGLQSPLVNSISVDDEWPADFEISYELSSRKVVHGIKRAQGWSAGLVPPAVREPEQDWDSVPPSVEWDSASSDMGW
ncbi:hypothetical protein N3K66_007846 [Trichothecium roseum]|uniref:Uncharacterized protein n=1 Tax=Trichothecium roseum TaxID=47278 RepID=A0ACC0URR1_9HYPO|nr:hypothetical protein N3K66_007846 [Trichothecium roseum]